MNKADIFHLISAITGFVTMTVVTGIVGCYTPSECLGTYWLGLITYMFYSSTLDNAISHSKQRIKELEDAKN